jgi:hypothetical protein
VPTRTTRPPIAPRELHRDRLLPAPCVSPDLCGNRHRRRYVTDSGTGQISGSTMSGCAPPCLSARRELRPRTRNARTGYGRSLSGVREEHYAGSRAAPEASMSLPGQSAVGSAKPRSTS